MYEIRFHGRGGQGAVMAAQTIAEAAVYEGLEAIAFPFFGAERRGAPIMAFARIDDKKIALRTQVYQPDMVVIMEESLIEIEPVADGLKPGGCAVVNSKLSPDQIDLGVKARCATVDATSIALEMLKAPIVNTAILGAMARADDFVSIKAVKEAIASRFGEHLGEEAGRINAQAAQMAYDKVDVGREPGPEADHQAQDVAAHLAGDAIGRGPVSREEGRDRGRSRFLVADPHRHLEDQDAPLPPGKVRALRPLLVHLPGRGHQAGGRRPHRHQL